MPERLISSIKPESEIDQKPPFDYNNKTWESYKANGFLPQDPIELNKFKIDRWERRFISMVDTTKGDIERKVTKIVRLKAIDNNSKKKERREYLIYYEDWFGKDFNGDPVPPVREHIEGLYYEQEREPIYIDRRLHHYERSGEHPVYYIPYTKKTLDDIIANSIGSDQETISYLVKFNDSERDDSFNYSQFASSSFTDLYRLHAQKGGPRFAAVGQE